MVSQISIFSRDTGPGAARCVLLATLAGAAASSPRAAEAQEATSDWPAYGGTYAGTRHSTLDQIDRGNVSRLGVAWTFRTGELGQNARDGGDLTFEATPVHFEGRLYLPTAFGTVIALDPVTGVEIWRYDAGVRRDRSYSEVTSRGVAAWRDPDARPGAACAARLLYGTIDARLIALDAVTGSPCLNFGDDGAVDLRLGSGVEADEAGNYQVTSAPVVVDDVVVIGSSIGDNWRVDTGSGSVRGFDVRSGERLWSWDPILRTGEVGAANAWSSFAADLDRGLVYVPTGSASPDFFGGLRPGRGEWANSVVALRARTGELAWGFQTVRHDLFDYDVAAQPTLVSVRRGDQPVDAVVQATKSGFLFVLDRETGTPLFEIEDRPVPASDVPGEAASSTQPFPTLPEPLIPPLEAVPNWGVSDEHRAACAAMAEGYSTRGMFTPPSLVGTVMWPGNGAGTNWGGGAWDPERGVFVVPTLRYATLVKLVPAASVDSVFAALRASGTTAEVGRQRGAPFSMVRKSWLAGGIPCTPPPWGVLTAVDLSTGQKVWEIPFGEADPAFPGTGTILSGGPLITAGGLLFMAATPEGLLRALDIETGRELWRGPLPRAGIATPMTYRGADGRQYIVIAAGGHGKIGLEQGDYVVAFALPGE